jgi:ABC-2 type transport system permease protein
VVTMHIYKHELKMTLRSAVTWSISLIVLIFIYMALFPSFSKDAEAMNEAMEKFPREFLIAFGIADIDLSTVLGFYGMVFLFCQVCLAIQAANYGFSLVSIEERELTADFLLAKPVQRTTILTSKFLAAFTALTFTNLVTWISTFAAITLFKDGKSYDSTALIVLLLSIVLFQLFFLTVGVLISLLVKRIRSVTSASMALAFGMYLLNAFGGMIGETSLEIFSPFKHFEPNYVLSHATYDMPWMPITVIVTGAAVIASYVLYLKRDIHTAV